MLNLLNNLTGKNHHYYYCNPSGLARIIQRSDAIESDEFLTFIRLSLRFENANDKRTHIQISYIGSRDPASRLTGTGHFGRKARGEDSRARRARATTRGTGAPRTNDWIGEGNRQR
jgi:hypothetical protein